MVEQAKHAQANAEQKVKTANQTVNENEQFDFFLYSFLFRSTLLLLKIPN